MQLARSNIDRTYPYEEQGAAPLPPPPFLRTVCTELSCDWTAVVDTHSPPRPLPDDMLAALRCYVSQIQESSQRMNRPRRQQHPQQSETPLQPLPEMIEHVKRLVTSTRTGRMFGVAEKGYYGLFPRNTWPSELVCLFNGSPVRSCVRPQTGEGGRDVETKLALVGSCYIQDVVGLKNRSPFRPDEFVLI